MNYRLDFRSDKNRLMRVIDAAEQLGIGVYRLRQLIKSGAPIPGLCQSLDGQYWIAKWGVEEFQWRLVKAQVLD